jgi:hypothetical protein
MKSQEAAGGLLLVKAAGDYVQCYTAVQCNRNNRPVLRYGKYRWIGHR